MNIILEYGSGLGSEKIGEKQINVKVYLFTKKKHLKRALNSENTGILAQNAEKQINQAFVN